MTSRSSSPPASSTNLLTISACQRCPSRRREHSEHPDTPGRPVAALGNAKISGVDSLQRHQKSLFFLSLRFLSTMIPNISTKCP